MTGSHNEQLVDAPASVVFDVVVDPTTYTEWLVGTQAITDVEPSWPQVGATFSHRIGMGRLHTPGSTTIRAIEPGERLDLAAGMGPFGEASVRIAVRPLEQGTMVEIHEVPRGDSRSWRTGSPALRWPGRSGAATPSRSARCATLPRSATAPHPSDRPPVAAGP